MVVQNQLMKLTLVLDLHFSVRLTGAIIRLLLLPIILTLTGNYLSLANAEVYLSQEEALKVAFPENTEVEHKTYILDHELKLKIEKLAQAPQESSLVGFYIGKIEDQILGYAAIESVLVRTHYQTYMVVLSADGRIEKTVILAFYEPAEYITPAKWLLQFNNLTDPTTAKVGDNIAGIVGSTLSSNSIAAGVRRIAAQFKVLIGSQP